jgi:hypothetical protein
VSLSKRFLSDKGGTYDLASVSAVTAGGAIRTAKDGPTKQNAILLTDGGNSIHTDTDYADAVDAWTDYLESEDAPAPAPAAAAAPASEGSGTAK